MTTSNFRSKLYAKSVVEAPHAEQNPAESVYGFAEQLVQSMKALGRDRTAETYAVTLNSFKRFCRMDDLSFDQIDSDLIEAYEAYLKRIGAQPNTTSFYMRNLRAIYNRAVEKDLVVQANPFRHVYTGVDKTVKRAITLADIRRIKELDLTVNPAQALSRDIFLFSFYTRGMAFVDIAHLKKRDLRGGVLSYRRRKTGQQLFIKWEKCMQDIVDKYKSAGSPYLLPLIDHNVGDERPQYLSMSHKINRHLKRIGQQAGISIPLTMYVARHAWASIARSRNIPLSIISEGMGHDSESTTRIYLASLDNSAIDNANSIILGLL